MILRRTRLLGVRRLVGALVRGGWRRTVAKTSADVSCLSESWSRPAATGQSADKAGALQGDALNHETIPSTCRSPWHS